MTVCRIQLREEQIGSQYLVPCCPRSLRRRPARRRVTSPRRPRTPPLPRPRPRHRRRTSSAHSPTPRPPSRRSAPTRPPTSRWGRGSRGTSPCGTPLWTAGRDENWRYLRAVAPRFTTVLRGTISYKLRHFHWPLPRSTDSIANKNECI